MIEPLVVTLTDIEQRLARYVAKQRSQQGRDAFANGIDDRTCEERLVVGYGAELAFCKMHNLYPDLTIPGGVADCERFGESIDVKTTSHADGRLMVAGWKASRDKPAYYVLLIEEWPRYRVAGFASAADVFRAERLQDIRIPTYCVAQDELKDQQ
jgi:hypothetical protein